MDETDRAMLECVADYQWGEGAGPALFAGNPEVTHTASGRPRQVRTDAGRLVTYATDGRFTLGFAGGERLQATLSPPRYRVVVGDESEPFVRDGKNVFAKFVQRADEGVRPGDEVLVVHADGSLLAVGRAELAGPELLDFQSGEGVHVREGAGDPA